MNARQRYGRILVNLLIAVVVILLLVFVLPRVIVFFMPFVIGWVIALIANPMVRFLEKRVKLRRKQGSALIIVLVIGGVCTLLYFLIVALVRQVMGLIQDAPQIFSSLQYQISLLGDKLTGVYERFPADVQKIVDSVISGVSSSAEGFMEKIEMPSIGGASNMAKGVVDVIMMTIIALMASYFFVAERDELGGKFRDAIPREWYERYVMVKSYFAQAVGGYFKAQFKIMLVLVVVIFIGFEILGVNYSFLLALLIAALDFLPVLGTGTVLWPWMVMELLNANYFRLVGLLVIYVLCQVLKQILQPKMVGDSIGMSPLATLLFLYVGYKFGGVLGMIIGIPIGMVIVNFYRAGMFDPLIADIRTIAQDINQYRRGGKE